jgi:hypothetical protein
VVSGPCLHWHGLVGARSVGSRLGPALYKSEIYIMAIQNQFTQARGFIGLDLMSAPQDIQAGYSQQMDNLFVDGRILKSRPGIQGLLTTPFGSASYGLVAYKKLNNVTELVYCNGGKLFRQVKGAATATEILLNGSTSFNLNSATVQMQRIGKYLYVIDGQPTTPLYRIDLDASPAATAVTALTFPTIALSVSLTNTVLDSTSDVTKWAGQPTFNFTPFPASNSVGGGMIGNPTFIGGSGNSHDPPPPGWQTGGDTMDFQSVYSNPSAAYFDSGGGPQWVDIEAPNAYYGTTTFTYTDLVLVSGGGGLTVSSAARPFVSTDKGSTIQIMGGTGFILNIYTIASVAAGIASLTSSAGTAASTGGKGTLVAQTNTIRNPRVFLSSASVGLKTGGGTGKIDAILIPESHTITSKPVVVINDLSITATGSFNTIVHSNTYTFVSGDVGKIITITSGTSFTVGAYTIISVSGGNATVQGNAGTVGASSGVMQLGLDASATSWGDHNYSLENPPSAIPGGAIDIPVSVPPGVLTVNNSVFSLTSLTMDPDYIRLRWLGPAQEPALTGVVSSTLQPVDVRLLVSNASGNNGIRLSANNPNNTKGFGFNCLGGSWVRRDYTSAPLDLSTATNISMGYSAPASQGQIPFRFGFQSHGDPISAIKWSAPVTYSPDGTYFSTDISPFSAASRAAIDYIYIQILTDLPTTTDPTNVCTLGPLTLAGNLSATSGSAYAGPYTYVYTEVATTAQGDIETDPAPVSNQISANGLTAEAIFTIPAAVNGATTSFNIYRYGGTLVTQDGPPVAYLVANVPVAGPSQAAFDSTHTYTWNYVTRVFVDNTPDYALVTATTLVTGRGAPPLGAQAMCEWQGRLWLSKGSVLYGSWLITSTSAAALYFNATITPDDPYAVIKGIQFSVGGTDNDNIAALMPHGAELMVLKGRAIRVVTGLDAINFALIDYHSHSGIGCIAPRAVELIGNNESGVGNIWTLASSGLFEYIGGGSSLAPANRSLLIQPQLNPSEVGLPALQPAAYAGSCCIYHGQRLYLSTPNAPADTRNTVTWVYDFRMGGWTKYLFGCTGFAATSSSSDNNDLFLTGYDGQIYALQGHGDKATPAAAATAVQVNYKSRGFGQESAGDAYYRTNKPQRFHADFTTQETAVATLTAVANNCPQVWTLAYTVNGAYGEKPLKINSGVRGDYVTASISLSTVTESRINSVAIVMAEGQYNG